MRRTTILSIGIAAAICWGDLTGGALTQTAVADDAKVEVAQDQPTVDAKEDEKPKSQPESKKAKPDKPQAAAMPAKAKPAGRNPIAKAVGKFIVDAVKALRAPRNVAPAIRQMNADAAAIRQIEQQLSGQFKQLHRTELHFVRVVCQPTKQQYEKISADGDAELKRIVREFAGLQRKMQRGRRRGEDEAKMSDPRQRISAVLMKSIRANLTADQAARYQRELDFRAAARKQTTILNMVAQLDKKLVLSADQRSQLTEVVKAEWKESWGGAQRLLYMSNSIPPIPDKKVLPLLSQTQKAVWAGMPKQQNTFFGLNMFMLQGVAIEEEVWDEDQAEESQEATAAEAEPKKSGKPEVKQ